VKLDLDLSKKLDEERRKRAGHPWRDDRPPDRVLVASNGTSSVVLEHIGPAIAYWEETAGIAHDEFGALPAGLLIIEVDVREWKCATMDGMEYDAELEVLSVRPATDDEVRAQVDGEYPWDPNEWMIDSNDESSCDSPRCRTNTHKVNESFCMRCRKRDAARVIS